jgi:hypothetical protein
MGSITNHAEQRRSGLPCRRGQTDEDTFEQVDNNVYYNPKGRYSFAGISLDDWRRMGLAAHTNFADPLFVDRENHDYRLEPDSPPPKLGFKDIDTGRIGLREDFPYKDGGRVSSEREQG